MVAVGGFAVGFAAAMVAVMAGVTVNVVEIQTFIAQNGARNGCLPDPCENGGTCTREDRLGNFTCVCPSEYTGSTCSEDNVFCTSDPCQNGGTCTELYPGYNCTCASGYEGTHCENSTAATYSLLQSKLNLVDTAGINEGIDVAMSGDGLRIAQGAFFYDTPVTNFGMFSVYSRSAAGEAFADESGVLQGTTGGSNETNTQMGTSLALDYDGDTLVVGAPGEGSGDEGAVWVFTRTGSTWTQQGAKITAGVSSAQFGRVCTVSDDGNTLVAAQTQSSVGELHVYTRSGETWSAHASNPIEQNDGTFPGVVTCLAISGDGSTIVAGFQGAFNDGANAGAVWIFVDNGTAWVQQGTYINASISAANVNFGKSCDISYDGNVIAVGTTDDSAFGDAGAVVVFNRTGETWEEVAIVLSEVQAVNELFSTVALSANATVMAVGADFVDGGNGVVEVFVSSEGNVSSWTKVGSDLEATGRVGNPRMGASVDIDADGSVVVAGGRVDDSSKGALWVFSNE